MSWPEILEKLDFSFWQILIALVLVMFRKQLVQLFDRMRGVKLFDAEVMLAEQRRSLRELQAVRESIRESKGARSEEALGRLDRVIRAEYDLALRSVRRASPDLFTVITEQRELPSEVRVKSGTLELLYPALQTLRDVGVIQFEIIAGHDHVAVALQSVDPELRTAVGHTR